jgi:hypothetical protein
LAVAPEDLAGDDPAFEIVNRLRSIWPKELALTPTRSRILVRRRDPKHPVRMSPPQNEHLLFEDGTEIGHLPDVVRALINANFEKVVEQIGLADIDSDMTSAFVFEVGPPWTVKVDGVERAVCVRADDGDVYPIEKLVVAGEAAIRVTEVSLTHRRLGDVSYAYGEGEIRGQPAVIVVTETAEGGKLTLRTKPPRPT